MDVDSIMTAPKNDLRNNLLRSALQTGFTYCPAACAIAVATVSSLSAQTISINLASDRQAVDTAAAANPAGALSVSGEYWNNASGANDSLAAGTVIDETGAVVDGLSIDWTSNNTYFSTAGAATGTSENAHLNKGYLDDGGAGWTVTFNNSQFLLSDVYAIRASDQSNPATYNPVQIDGAFYTWDGSQTVYASSYNSTYSGENWTDADALVEGDHYLKIASAPLITIAGDRGNSGRNPIAGLQILNAYSGTLSYWDANGPTAGSGDSGDADLDGTWGTDSFWTSDANGELATAAWAPGNAAVFSAGTDGINTHTVTLNGTQAADAVWVQQGAIALAGGILDLSGGLGLLRGDDSGLTVGSQINATDLTTAGTVTLSNALNTITGTVNAGGMTLLTADQSWNQIAGAGEVNIDSAATLTIGATDLDSTFTGNFSGDGSVVKDGTGDLTLLAGSTGLTGTLDIADGGVILTNAGGAFTSTIPFTGAGSLTFVGSGSSEPSVTAGGDLSGFTGSVTIDGARVGADSSGGNRLGSGDITVLSGGQLWTTGGALPNNVFINGNGTTENAGQLGAIRLENGTSVSGDVTLQSDSRITTWTGAVGTVSGALSGAFNLSKTGSGTLVIESTGNTGYTGQTTVNSGRIRLAAETSLGSTPGAPTADSIILESGGRIQGGTSGAGADISISANRGITLASGDSGFHTWTGFTTTVDAPIVGTGRLTASDGGNLVLNGDITLDNGLYIASGTTTVNGDLDLTGAIRVQGSSTLNVNSASVVADGGFDLGTGTTNINLGNGAGGLMLLEDWELGQNGSQPHTSNLTAGDVRVENDIRIGHWGGSDSSLNISDGSLSQPDTATGNKGQGNEGEAILFIGISGTGELNISGGTVNAYGVTLDNRGDTTGTDLLSLTGGTLNVGEWGIDTDGNSSFLVQLGGGTVGTTSSSTEAGYDWSSDWSSSLPIELTGTNGDTSFQGGAHTITLTGALSGAGGFSVDSGTLALSGTGSYAGNTVVNGGILHISGDATGPSAVTVASGGTLRPGTVGTGGSATVESLTLANGSDSVFRLGSDEITVSASNGFTTSTSHTLSVVPAGALQTGDQFPLINYSGTIQGDGFDGLTLTPLANPHYNISLFDTGTSVDLKVDSITPSVWTAAGSDFWDLTSNNWNDGAPSMFLTQDIATFNDLGALQEVFVDTGGGAIEPAAMVFNNTTATTYVLDGDPVSGTGGIIKTGDGELILASANTFSGINDIQDGLVLLEDAAGLGGPGNITMIGATATLDVNGLDLEATGQVIQTEGTIINGSTDLATINSLELTGDATLDLDNKMIVGANNSAGGSLELGSNTLTKTGSGQLVLNGVSISSGNITINEGSIRLIKDYNNNQRTVSLTGPGLLTINPGTSLVTDRWATGFTVSMPIVLNGGTIGSDWPGPNNATIASPINVTADSSLNFTGGYDGVFLSGVISGPGVITHNGQNTRLTGNNDWSGGMINNGTIRVGTGGTSGTLGTGPITNNSNIFLQRSDDFTVSNDIGGSGSITKQGANNVTLTGQNTYTGNTVLEEGGIVLADGATLTFAPGAVGVTNSISGIGGAVLEGAFDIDLSGADLTDGNSWTLVTSSFKTFASTFSVVGFTEDTNVHTFVDGPNTWTFTESTSELTLEVTATPYESYEIANNIPGAGPDTDSDGDGIDNGIEFVIGGVSDPLIGQNDSDKLPVGSLVNADPDEDTNFDDYFLFSFPRTDDSAGTSSYAEYGSTLTGWTEAEAGVDGVVILETDNGAVDQVDVYIPQSLIGTTTGFARLQVDIP